METFADQTVSHQATSQAINKSRLAAIQMHDQLKVHHLMPGYMTGLHAVRLQV